MKSGGDGERETQQNILTDENPPTEVVDDVKDLMCWEELEFVLKDHAEFDGPVATVGCSFPFAAWIAPFCGHGTTDTLWSASPADKKRMVDDFLHYSFL